MTLWIALRLPSLGCSEQSRERNTTLHFLPLFRFSVVHGVRLGAFTSDLTFQGKFEAEK